MATGNVFVSVVDVGQGQCTFVEVYDNSMVPVLLHTLLFDCGSDKKSNQTEANLQYMANKISGMAVPTIDCIFFSHSDKDHISLTKDLLELCTKNPRVLEVWYGGDRSNYTKSGFNILDYLIYWNYCKDTDIKSTGSNYTGYNKLLKRYTQHLWRSPDNTVVVLPVVSNVLSDDPDWDDQDLGLQGASAEARNRVSMVCQLEYADRSYVICGDATNKTMASIIGVFSGGTTAFNANEMTTIPHHGSRATGFAVPSSMDASTGAVKVVDTFATIMNSRQITVSANQKHRHPSLQIINRFIPTITTPVLRDGRLIQKNSHLVTANIDMAIGTVSGLTIYLSNDYSFETTINTFSTKYYDGTPTFSYQIGTLLAKASSGVVFGKIINEHASWKFKTAANGATIVSGHVNLTQAAFTALPVAFGKSVHEALLLREEPVRVRVRTNTPHTFRQAQKIRQFQRNIKQFH